MSYFLDKFLLNNKVAFITGGLGLIGREIVHAFAEAGAQTVILDIDAEKGKQLVNEHNQRNHTCHFEYFDITLIHQIEENVNKLIQKYGKIDIWVNCAYPRTPDWGAGVEDLNIDSWEKNIQMHLSSYALLTRYVGMMMKKNNIHGNIINFGSIYGVVGNDFSLYKDTSIKPPMAYSAIKGGILNLTRFMASYFGPSGIRINNICPGGVFDYQDDRFIQNYNNKVPLRRLADPKEIASVVLFMASDASSYMTGSTIMVDGGYTAI